MQNRLHPAIERTFAAKGIDLVGYPELIPGNAELIPFGIEELERIAAYEIE